MEKQHRSAISDYPVHAISGLTVRSDFRGLSMCVHSVTYVRVHIVVAFPLSLHFGIFWPNVLERSSQASLTLLVPSGFSPPGAAISL